MKKPLLLICLFITASACAQGPLKKRVIMHQLQDDRSALLAEIGAKNVNQAKRKIKRLNELLSYLETSNVHDALKKIKKSDARIYKREKQNEKLAAHNEQLVAHADSLESTLQDIIQTKNEYQRSHQTHIDIFAKIPKKLPKIKKR